MPRAPEKKFHIKLEISILAWHKLMAYVRLCPTEINGFGYVKWVDRSTLRLSSPDDIFITKQRVNMAAAEVDPETLGRAHYAAVLAGREGELRLQWHSHVDGDAYFSSIDVENIEGFGETGAEWLLSLVLNTRGQLAAQVDGFKPFRFTVPVHLAYIVEGQEALDATVLAEIKELVHELPSEVGEGAMLRLVWSGDPDDEAQVEVFESEDDEPVVLDWSEAAQLFEDLDKVFPAYRVAQDQKASATKRGARRGRSR